MAFKKIKVSDLKLPNYVSAYDYVHDNKVYSLEAEISSTDDLDLTRLNIELSKEWKMEIQVDEGFSGDFYFDNGGGLNSFYITFDPNDILITDDMTGDERGFTVGNYDNSIAHNIEITYTPLDNYDNINHMSILEKNIGYNVTVKIDNNTPRSVDFTIVYSIEYMIDNCYGYLPSYICSHILTSIYNEEDFNAKLYSVKTISQNIPSNEINEKIEEKIGTILTNKNEITGIKKIDSISNQTVSLNYLLSNRFNIDFNATHNLICDITFQQQNTDTTLTFHLEKTYNNSNLSYFIIDGEEVIDYYGEEYIGYINDWLKNSSTDTSREDIHISFDDYYSLFYLYKDTEILASTMDMDGLSFFDPFDYDWILSSIKVAQGTMYDLTISPIVDSLNNHTHGFVDGESYLHAVSDGTVIQESGYFLMTNSHGLLIPNPHATNMLKNSYAYDNIKTGESTSLTMNNQKKINDGINTALGNKANSTHNHTSSNVTDMGTVAVTITYTDNTTETLTLFKQNSS